MGRDDDKKAQSESATRAFLLVDERLRQLRHQHHRHQRAWTTWRLVTIGVLSGLAAVTFGALAGTDWGQLGWLFLAAGFGFAIAVVRRTWIGPTRRWSDLERVARFVEDELGGFHSSLVTAVQADRARRGLREDFPGSGGPQAEIAARAALDRLASADLRLLIDTGERRLAKKRALLVAAICLATTWLFPQTVSRGVSHLMTSPEPISAHGQPVSEVAILVEDLSLRMVFPEYLGRKERVIERSRGDFSAAEGTQVMIQGRVSLSVSALALELASDPGGRWPVTLHPQGTIETTLRVGSEDQYRFVGLSASGQLLVERDWHRIEASSDAIPSVRLILPESDMEVGPEDSVMLVYEAFDDHGLSKVDLVVQVGDSASPTRKTIARLNGERHTGANLEVTVVELGLVAGERAEVWFEAFDNNPRLSPIPGQSPKRLIRIYSPEDEHSARLTDLEAIIEGLIEVLADRLESPLEARQASELRHYIEVQHAIATKEAVVLEAFGRVVAAMRADSLASEALNEPLADLLQRLHAHADTERAQLRQARSTASVTRRPGQFLRVLWELNSEGTVSVEEASWALRDLVSRAREERLLTQGRDLMESQNDLLELLSDLAQSPQDAATAERANRKLNELQATLQRMAEELQNLAERMPYERQNLMAEPSDGEQDVRNLTDSLAEIRDLMAQGRFEEAMKRLEQLNQETQEMMAAMQNELEGLKAPSEEAQAALSQLDQTLDRLVDEQSGLHGETQEVDKQRLRRQADKLQEALAEARAVAKQVSAQLNATSETGLHPSDSEALETNRRHSAELQMTLDRGEVESARRQAVGMRDGLKALGKEVSESESREEDDTRLEALRDTRRGLEKATGLATRLTELLEQLDTPSEPLSPNERRQTSRLEARQKRLARELGKLERTLEEVEAQSPELRAELEPVFQQASESMERARAELSRRGIKPAAQHQRDALDQMGQAKGQIERHIRQTPRRQGRGSVGLNRPDQKVEIPDSESFRSSSQLRDELLKAMGERAPEAYEEAIDQYYEELVK